MLTTNPQLEIKIAAKHVIADQFTAPQRVLLLLDLCDESVQITDLAETKVAYLEALDLMTYGASGFEGRVNTQVKHMLESIYASV